MDATKEHEYLGQQFTNVSTATNIERPMESDENEFVWLQLFADNEVEEPINKEFINERIISTAKEEELIKAQEALTQASSEENIVEFMNPHKVTGKRRYKRTSYYNEGMSQETSSKKKREYTCSFCKKPVHNISTCPNRR
ncbi:hypothetical protein C2G38_2159416 [Gigaspora rosea]|uniref:Uncharacterized protein n=1 Tax=Gigaspora rosea TaxID=44941 RepID=A0A397VZF9_9GLOM|nr:hypothetical protein C2G38_2159416 [Gigaspora rosea]